MTESLVFSRFELLPAQRRLLERGAPVTLGSRAFDLLVMLVEQRDRVVSRDELLRRVWHDVVVEENNLAVQIATLRKVLGAQAVATVSGHGYRFTLPVSGGPISPGPRPAADTALALPDKPSIAMLPLARRGGDAAHDDFVDGITDELITGLSRHHALFVVARGSAFSYSGRDVDVRTVARELGVRYVLEGSVRRTHAQVRVAVQLIDAAAGRQIWAERYERELQDVFTLQDDVAGAIVAALAPQIETSEIRRMDGAPMPRDTSAQDLALHAWARARSGLARSNAAERNEAIALARQALALDPHSSTALDALIDALSWHLYHATVPAEAARAETLEAVARALELDSADHLAWRGRGWMSFAAGRMADALSDLRRSLALNPNDAFTLARLGVCEALTGDPVGGTARCLHALRLSPRDPARFHLLDCLTWACFASKHYAQAIDTAHESLREADFVGTRLCLVLSLVGAGDLPQAAAELRQLRALAPDFVASRLSGTWLAAEPEVRQREAEFMDAANAYERATHAATRGAGAV